MKKITGVFLLTFGFIASTTAQINVEKLGKSAADAYINDGEIILSHSPEFSEKKKNANKISEIDPSKPLFITIALKRKITSHGAFQSDNGVPFTWLKISLKNGKSVSVQMHFKKEDASNKFGTFQLSSNPLNTSNNIHKDLAEVFGNLSKDKHAVTFELERDEKIKTSLDINCTSGTGIYGALFQELENERKRTEEEARLKKEAEEKMKKEAIDKYNASPDIVKIYINNKGEFPAKIKIETGNVHTNQFSTVAKGKKSDFIACRPGDKVYVGNEFVHTVAASSNNKTIDVTPKRPETSPDCAFGSRRISYVQLENKTGRYLRYRISGDGASNQGSIFVNGTDKISCCPYGYQLEINIIDEQNAQENSSNYKTYITITQEHEGKVIVIQ
jgi:hypothetical protein